MSLPPGSRIGPYEIVGQLGAGGMGEVYRARDAKLNRDVAIKILPEAFAGDPDRLARFNREAQALAAMNHPNIAGIYGMESSALVMELVEGQDLSALIGNGMPFEDALPIARQIIDALEAAHEQGIIHRDLKPANIKVRTDGTVKILDFGLAKAMDPSSKDPSAISNAMNSPTMTARATQLGMILGTAAYMAPEQAKGRAVDKRADIWAFGAVLFEMLTGTRAFSGEDVSETLASVLKDPPALASLPSGIPPSVRLLLDRCLQKDPRQRLRDIGDARHLLDDSTEDKAQPATVPAVQPVVSSRLSKVVPWVIAATAVVGALFIAPRWRQPAAAPAPSARFVIPTQDVKDVNPVLSSDGRFIVYNADRLYVHRFDEFEAHALPGTAGARMPFISPDGRWVGFFADGKIRRVSVAGAETADITAATVDSPGAAFISNDQVLFSPGWVNGPLQSVSVNGGAVTAVSTIDSASGERGHWWPHALPDGRHVLFTVWYAASGLSASRIAVLDLQTKTHRVLFPGAMASYAAGHLLYYRAGQYQLAAFDPVAMKMTGESTAVLPEAIGLDPTGDNEKPVSLSASGAVAYWPGELNPVETLTWIDRAGTRTPTSLALRIEGAELSPDGRKLAVGKPEGGANQIWIYDFSGGEQRLAGEGSNWGPIWHPDGTRLAYTSLRKGNYDVATQSLDGAQEYALAEENDESALAWLSDGRLVINEWLPNGHTALHVVAADRKTRQPIVAAQFLTHGAKASSDGRWLALCASPSGTRALYARSMVKDGALERLAGGVSDNCDIRWSAATKEILFTRPNALVSVTYEERAGHLVVVKETTLASIPSNAYLYGISPDGQRFLMGIAAAPTSKAAPGIRVILDGIASLRAK